MTLDKIMIGERIRRIREEMFKEKRSEFANRCGLTERHVGQIERGEFLLNIKTLDKIVCTTGADINYILYGKSKDRICKEKENLKLIIEMSTKDELNMYYRCIETIRNYITKEDYKNIKCQD